MCGIIGYTGTKDATNIILDGLAALEYRGYDSAGVSLGGAVVKTVGKVAALRDAVTAAGLPAVTTGIGHTRWATHGEPTERNAHPHLDATGTIHIVHNGIIENWRELRAGLEAQGHTFVSDTDTEVLAQLIGHHYTGDIEMAVSTALSLVRGAYGLVVWLKDNPETLVVARQGSPIVIGVTDGARFVASDPAPLLQYTKRLIFLADGEVAVLTPQTHAVKTLAGETTEVVEESVTMDVSIAKKEGYEHFMAKEMFEAPQVIRNTIRGRVVPDLTTAKLGGLETVRAELRQLQQLTIVGCGSASYAGMIGKLGLERYAGMKTSVEIASEYRYRHQLATEHEAVLAITQSGETADTLASIKDAKARGLLTLGIVNVVGSSIARETAAGVYNHAGPEVAVASTKAFLSQVTVLVLLTVFLGRERGFMDEETATEILTGLADLPAVLETVLTDTTIIESIAKHFSNATNMMYIGRDVYAPLAAEGALKLKEVTYIHAEAYPAGELKHGSIALLGPDFPVFALLFGEETYEKTLSNIEEVKARRSPLIVLATTDDTAAGELTEHVIRVPRVHPLLQPIVAAVPLQLFAYYVGVAKGLDVDRPRNLAKSVTVE